MNHNKEGMTHGRGFKSMKKKLLLLTSLIVVATSLAGCGEVTVSYKGHIGSRVAISSESSSKSSVTPTEYVSPYVAYGYDTSYYQPDYNSYSTKGVAQFLNDSHIDSRGFPTYNVTPKSISNLTDEIQIMTIRDNTYALFLYLPSQKNSFPMCSDIDAQAMQIGLNDYDSNGVDDIVIWSQDKTTSSYIIDIFDMTRKGLLNVVRLSFEHPDDLLFFIYETGFYVNQHKVYYVSGQFYCTGVFDYRYPSYY